LFCFNCVFTAWLCHTANKKVNDTNIQEKTGNNSSSISNIRVEQDRELRYYKIAFDLSGEVGDQYLIQVVPHKDGRELSDLSYLTGAGIDSFIEPGKNHSVYWDAILEGYESEGWQFQIKANLKPKGMIFVKGGSFQMGSNSGDGDESPIHEVTVSSFWIGKYQVTQKEWTEVMGNNPSGRKGKNLPVEMVIWYEVVEYCNKRSILEGLTPCYSGSGSNITCNWGANGYRLPTEAEWEYAARGGLKSKGYKYSGSNSIGTVAWYDENSGSRTHEVGTKKPNELGIHDMSGNVWEWCWDWYAGSYYKKSPSINPKGPNSGSYRVLRGGSWNFNHDFCRISYRDINNPNEGNNNYGFRVCRTFFN
jgi:formylglycine-generating enzyme required for sulfatase activity